MHATDPQTCWSRQIHEFNTSNAGRLALLETDDPTVEGELTDRFYSLHEVSYSTGDNRLDIELRGLRTTDLRLVHRITDPEKIHLQTAKDGRDSALWVARGSGRMLLRLF